jgi:hypothetical protein
MGLHRKSSRGNSEAKMTENEPATKTQIKRICAVLHSLKINPKDFKKSQSIQSFEQLTRRQIWDKIEELEKQEQENKQKESTSPGGPRTREQLKTIMQESLEDAEEILKEYAVNKAGYTAEISIVDAQIAIALFNQRVKD